MRQDAQPVTVYAFMTLDHGFETPELAPFKATREAIQTRFSGQVLEGTAQQVDAELLDGEGRLLRVPTGWGELTA
jgi:hypothetical protein